MKKLKKRINYNHLSLNEYTLDEFIKILQDYRQEGFTNIEFESDYESSYCSMVLETLVDETDEEFEKRVKKVVYEAEQKKLNEAYRELNLYHELRDKYGDK